MRRFAQLFCSFALATALISTAHVPVAAEAPPTAIATAVSRIRIDNFGQINPNYYRGAQPTGRDYADLAGLGIKTVIDLQLDGDPGERALVERAGMKFYRIPMTTRVAPTASQLTDFLRLVNEPSSLPVYVHCAGGRHRTGVMTAVYRMEKDGWTADRAFQEMKNYKFGMDFLHPEFKSFVYSYRPTMLEALAISKSS
jgi:protein tyrosine/serine phosphatase